MIGIAILRFADVGSRIAIAIGTAFGRAGAGPRRQSADFSLRLADLAGRTVWVCLTWRWRELVPAGSLVRTAEVSVADGEAVGPIKSLAVDAALAGWARVITCAADALAGVADAGARRAGLAQGAAVLGYVADLAESVRTKVAARAGCIRGGALLTAAALAGDCAI